MVKLIDNFLNSITMYKAVLYGLLFISSISFVLSLFGILPFTPISLIISIIILCGVCYLTNLFFGIILRAPRNNESWIISALILFLILIPPADVNDIASLVIAGILAMSSKYILAINKKHIFNPVAISLFILTLLGSSSVFWWAGSKELLPFVLIIGLLIVRKIRRFDLFLSFLTVSVIVIFVRSTPIDEIFLSWPVIFFGTIMLTEPLTSPPTRAKRIIYGGLVGILFAFISPEISLIVGNIFSYLVSPKQKLFLKLKEKLKLAPDIYEFVFSGKLPFKSGQYLEWTLPHKSEDLRGNRRYFTIASSPTESEIKLGIKVNEKSSSFKKALTSMKSGEEIVASQLTGDFTLPDTNQKLVFIAGGIGVTPFRSMIQNMIDTNQSRDIVFFYSSADPESFVYREIFEKAQNLGLKTLYILTDDKNLPKNWRGKVGYITSDMVKEEVSDYKNRLFYLSGPSAMVDAYKDLLGKLGISIDKIVTDYFPGF